MGLGRALRWRVAVLALVVALAAAGTACNPDPTGGLRPPPAGDPSAPAWQGWIRDVTLDDVALSWREGCPVHWHDLRMVVVSYWGYDGKQHRGGLVVNKSVANQVLGAFRKIYDGRFQIRRIKPVDHYGADDTTSMNNNNTSAFNCRKVTGGTAWSQHSYGTAIDINPIQNPYVKGGVVLPESGRQWLDRSSVTPGMIVEGDVVVRAFVRDLGWGWGGRWSSLKDYQHLSQNNR